MTRQEALTDLLAKVEAGETVIVRGLIHQAFGRDHVGRWPIGRIIDWILDPDDIRAMGAAKALHEAALPGWTKVTIDSHRRMTHWTVEVERLHSSPSDDAQCITGRSDAPAPAWLTAIIKALIAMENDT